MRITGVKSICCGKSVRTLPLTKRKGDVLFECLRCRKPCDHYYVAETSQGKQ